MQFFLNSAKYLKVGQKLWVDHKFSSAVMNGIYHLHASTSGLENYFNDTYSNNCVTLSHHQVWAAFLQESTWQASETSEIDFVIPDVASIDEVTEKAFAVLGNNGRIQSAKDHACAECSQLYQAASNAIPSVGNSNTAAQDSGQMQNVTMKVIDGMVNGTKVFFIYF